MNIVQEQINPLKHCENPNLLDGFVDFSFVKERNVIGTYSFLFSFKNYIYLYYDISKKKNK